MSELVTNEMVTRGALEARAWGVVSKHGEWTDSEAQHQCTRDILEAAAPLIAAKALQDAADALVMGYKPDGVSTWQWLRDRAEPSPADRQAPVAAGPLDESDHRPRHDRGGGHWYRWPNGWGQTGGWFTLEEVAEPHGPLTFCDCDPTDSDRS